MDPRPRHPLNAFSVDVEDWYQVADFDAVVPFETWDRYESRVRRNTDKILQLLAEFGVKGDVLHPHLERRALPRGGRARSTPPGTRSRRTATRHRIVYEQTREQFRADVARAKKTLEDLTGEAVLGYRAPSFSFTAKSAVGPGRAPRSRLPLRLERVSR
jgi:peptidoglycan/xylan/chitin deacetylase (PgdA/CDA1 family)